MTIRDMQIFIEVAKTCNMTAAGKNLYLSQSTISQVILSIEKQYGVRLFDRLTRKLIITKQGEALLEYCKQILTLHTRLEYELRYASEKYIRIGATLISLSSILMNDIWGQYHQVCPDIKTQIIVEENDILSFKLQSDELDIAVTEEPIYHPDLVCQRICEDTFVLICPQGSEFSGRSSIQLQDLHGHCLIMREKGNPTRDLFEQTLLERKLQFDVKSYRNIDIIKTKVSQGEGVSIMASRLITSEVQQGLLQGIPIQDFSLKRYFYAVYHKDLHITPYIESFLRTCQTATCLQPKAAAPTELAVL